MDALPNDIIFEIYKRLPINDGYFFSLTNKSIYDIFVKCNLLWEHHLYSTFDKETIKLLWTQDYKMTFIKCHTLNKIRKELKFGNELGQLQNLQTLYLYNNQITSMPKELGQLQNLRTLYL